jgi:hypothetical protein
MWTDARLRSDSFTRSAAIGNEARRIGEEVGQWRAENDANPARKRLPL